MKLLCIKLQAARAAVLAALFAASLAPAQRPVNLYGGVFRPGQNIVVGVGAPARTLLRLERVRDPQKLFLALPDPHRPTLPPGIRTAFVRALHTPAKDYGEVHLGKLPSGVYVLRAGNIGTVLLVSDLGLVVKRDLGTALTYAADRESGATRAARVWHLGAGTGKSALANADGVARFGGAPKENEFFLARFGNSWAVSGSYWNAYAAPKVRGYVYTDRPVYRPGQHVDFKGVLRKAVTLTPLTNTSVRVTVFSPFGDAVFRKTLTTNGFGSLSAGLDLPESAKLGEYRFDVRPSGADGDGQSDVGGTFGVEAYQKPEYAVTVKPGAARAVQGEQVSVKISAKYLFGGNLGGARVTYNVTRAPYYPPGFDAEDLPPDTGTQDYGSDLVVNEQTRLDQNGELDLTLPLARAQDGRPQSYRIEAEVEDESRRTVSGFARVIAFPARLSVEATTDGYVYDAGKPIKLSLETRDLEGKARPAPVTLDLVRQVWEKVKGEYSLRETRVARTTVRTDARGQGSATLSASRGGGYLIRATVRDAQGRASSFENFAWVLKKGEDWGWNYRDMTVKLDKRSYAPGDTATALIGNPKPGAPVLVTLEGDRLRSSTVLRGKGAALTYRFPVTAEMSPNIAVAAVALGDGNFYSRDVPVRVPRAGAELKVSVVPEKARYKPGDTASFAVRVQDARGRGVPAEVALGVVDGAIYLVRPDSSTPLLSVFQAPRSNVVGTDSSLSFYFESGVIAAAPRAPQTEAAFAQSKAEPPGANALPDPTPREDFRDTILWVPNLVTDAQGRARVEVRFPDNLTTWVATARAQTKAPRFGQTTASTMTTKDVIARLSLPPFLVRGDTATLSGLVNNTLGQDVRGSASVKLSGLAPLDAGGLLNGAPISVRAKSRIREDFEVRASTVGTADVIFGARTASGGDALKLPLPVKARGYDVSVAAVGSARQPTVTLAVPGDANLATARLQVFLTPSLLSAVSPALEYLIGYPYGCTEQTMSRFLPALLAREALGQDALPEGVRRELPDITSAGLARLYAFQHDDGGWNFWEFDDSTLEMTAYVLEGLVRAKSLGVKVDNSVLDRAVKYLAGHVEISKEPQGPRASALRALADAGRANSERLSAFARRGDLEPYALAQLALALERIGKTQEARDLLDRLKAKRIEGQKGASVHWEKPKTKSAGGWFDFWDDNGIQVTAAALEALARIEPDSPLIPGIGQWLLESRRGPRWVSTQDTTNVIIAALALRRDDSQGRARPVRLSLNGQQLGEASVTSGGASVSLDLSAANLKMLKTGNNVLTLSGAPRGLTFAAQLSFAREPASLGGVADQGFALGRKYEKLEPVWDDKNKRYTYRRAPLLRGGELQPVTVGDLVLVTLNVRPSQKGARYLLISDPIPAGTKALDERSLAIAGLQDPENYDWSAWNYWYAGRDLLDDRVDLYADYLEGQQTVRYVLRAQTPGTFTALPTHAFLMYDPEVQGYGPAATLTVRDRGQ